MTKEEIVAKIKAIEAKENDIDKKTKQLLVRVTKQSERQKENDK